MNHHHSASFFQWQLLLDLLVVSLIVVYIAAAYLTGRTYRTWPTSRTLCWIFGMLCAALAITGPVAAKASHDFVAHMLVHLLLGMLSPLLLVMAAPVTLLLRSVSRNAARRLTGLLRSRLIAVLSSPVAASVLNIGGLWVLYTTPLFEAMHHSILWHIGIHLHVFLAGFVYTSSLLCIDPHPHHFSYRYRTAVFLISLAGHATLAKYIYAHPPFEVSIEQAQVGSMLMYYGGDFIDLVLIILLFSKWYHHISKRTPVLSQADLSFKQRET